MTATANPGYTFSHWQSPILITTPVTTTSVTINVNINETFTAYFNALNPGVSTLDESIGLSVFPNPVSDEFIISYSLQADERISLGLFDLVGNKITDLLSDEAVQKEGTHQIRIDAREYSLSDGVYFLKISSPGFSKMIKLVKTSN